MNTRASSTASPTTSPWIETTPRTSHPKLAADLDVDVAIVGAGITGITAAVLLKRAGRTVALIDARRIAEGETGHTTAHLSAYPDTRLSTLISRFGADGARRAWAAGEVAIRQIESLIQADDLRCGFRRVPAQLFTEHEEGLELLNAEYEACRTLGIAAELSSGGGALPFQTLGALRFEHQARFHPREYLLPLVDRIPGAGSHVFEETRAVSVDESPSPRVVTESGTIRAKDVVVASNVPINNRVLLQTKIAHYRTYALAVRTASEIEDALYWDDRDPYHYVRKHSIRGADLVIVGGEDHRTGHVQDTQERFDALEAWTALRFDVRSVEHRWSGQIVEPVDGLPYIGRNSFSEHVWEATGYSGNGMTFGTLAAMILADSILGRPNDYAELFHATRVNLRPSAATYVRENLAFPVHFVGDRLKPERRALSSLAPGEGSVISVEGVTLAVHRDEAGALHVLSPVCTHLRCIVAFNDAEKSWDCPCHGSRFDVDGNVLNGPATQGLERY